MRPPWGAGADPRLRPRVRRPRVVYVGLLLLTVALGLASRRFAADLPRAVAAYAGDTLWAAMVLWLLALLVPRGRTRVLAGAALAAAAAVEVSQLYRAPWLDAVRATRLGALALGHGFLWSDLLCYAAGVGGAALLDRALRRTVPGAAGGTGPARPGAA